MRAVRGCTPLTKPAEDDGIIFKASKSKSRKNAFCQNVNFNRLTNNFVNSKLTMHVKNRASPQLSRVGSHERFNAELIELRIKV